jgi:tRNA modification GTPase
VGEGGISIVRLSGPDALAIADRIFAARDGAKPSRFKSYTVHYGHIVKGNGDMIDEVILTVMRSPKSYTREDVVEINCHGGIGPAGKILDLIVRDGARIAEPGEFTKRAFLNGRLDLAQAEAVLDIIRARTEGSLKVALAQLKGGLSKEVNRIRDMAVDAASRNEALIDFPEEDLDIEIEAIRRDIGKISEEIKCLIDTFDDGVVLREGVLAVICGKPNVGKSSLMNLLLKRDRVIVTPVPGTTRDTVEEMISLKGIPVRLVDTAGIIETEDIIEAEGVKRSKGYVDTADLVLLVLDASAGIDERDDDIIKLTEGRKRIVIINKIDIRDPNMTAKNMAELFPKDGIIEISVLKKEGIAALERAILDAVWSGRFIQGESAMVANARHKELLEKALDNLAAVMRTCGRDHSPELAAIDLNEAVFNLGLIIGKSVSDDVLERIFENFCIGK